MPTKRPSKVVTPKGWKRLKRGALIKSGDNYWFDGWHRTGATGMQVESTLYIRKIRKAKNEK